MTKIHEVKWRKSSFSADPTETCVELGNTGSVRDSKNKTGPSLNLPWRSLVAAVKADLITR